MVHDPTFLLPVVMLALLAACAHPNGGATETMGPRPFGRLPDGRNVSLFTLANVNGLKVHIIDYGGIIVSLSTPDRHGVFADVVLGYNALDGYVDNPAFFGAVIGRYANRIDRGRFTLDGASYALATNDGPNHLHGGERGFDKVIWDAQPFRSSEGEGLVLSYTSPDGEEGYPGTLKARVTYVLRNDDALVVRYHAVTDAPTPVNLTQHTYFNLSGVAGDILEHVLFVDADQFTPVDSVLIPTGALRRVDGTPFDFRTPVAIGARIEDDDEQLRLGRGYDHSFVLNRSPGDTLSLAARVYAPGSGRRLDVLTTEPGIQVYSGNFLDGSLEGKGRVYGHRSGLCLETQHFPDSPNQPHFPTTILRPGETRSSETIFRFSVDGD